MWNKRHEGDPVNVGEQVEDMDADIARLRETLTTERTKRNQIDKLLEKYHSGVTVEEVVKP